MLSGNFSAKRCNYVLRLLRQHGTSNRATFGIPIGTSVFRAFGQPFAHADSGADGAAERVSVQVPDRTALAETDHVAVGTPKFESDIPPFVGPIADAHSVAHDVGRLQGP